MRAIARTLGEARSQSRCLETSPLFVGSVKTNVGHTEGCAGIASVIKTVHCLERGWIPPVVGLSDINPEISPVLSQFHMRIPTDILRWPGDPDSPRRASVNSFGFGGSNAHIILDDAASYLRMRKMEGVHATISLHSIPQRRDSLDSDSAYSSRSSESEVQSPIHPPPPRSSLLSRGLANQLADKPSSQVRLYLLSAHDEEGLGRVAESYATYLQEEQGHGNLPDLASTMKSLAHILATKSSHHYFRSFAVAQDYQELVGHFRDKSALSPPMRASHRNKIVFVFTGQGAQRPGMALELLGFPAFAESIHQSQNYLNVLGCDWDIRDVLSTASADTISRPEYSQPLCTTIQIALVHLLTDWGVQPAAVVGHSSGEIVAALAAGAISHENAIQVSWFRGKLSAELPSRSGMDGAMLAAGLSESDAIQCIASLGLDSVNVACINSPSSVTLAGPRNTIMELHDHLVENGKFARLLRTSVAYHSSQMISLTDEYAAALATLEAPRSTDVPMYSSVTEELIQGDQLDAEYWLNNMKNPVRFAGALANLLKNSTQDVVGEYSAVLEIGPTKTLEGPIRQIISSINSRLGDKLPYISTLSHEQDAYRASLQAAGQLWATGHSIDIDKVNQASNDTFPSLGSLLSRRPTYPWSHKRDFWHDTSTSRSARIRDRPRTDLLGAAVDVQNSFEPRWRNILSTNESPWLLDHNVASAILFPAAGYLVMALEAVVTLVHKPTGVESYGSFAKAAKGVEFLNVRFENGLVIPESRRGVEVHLTMKADDVFRDVFEFAVYSAPRHDAWTRLCRGHIRIVHEPEIDDDFGRQALQDDWEAQRSGPQRSSEATESTIDVAQFYARLNSLGLKYGPTFQGLASIKTAPGETRVQGTLRIPDTKSSMPNEFEYPHLIHPATLDSAFQLVFASLEAQNTLNTAAVPISVKRIFIASDLERDAGSVFMGTADARRIDAAKVSSAGKSGRASVSADVVFTDQPQAAPRIVIEDIRLQDVPTSSVGGEDRANSLLIPSTRRSARVIWKEDVELLDMEAEGGFDVFEDWIWDGSKVNEPLRKLCFWLDRLCHKKAGLNAALVGMDPQYERLLKDNFGPREDVDCRFSSANTLAIESLQHMIDTSHDTFGPYDLVFLDPSLLPKLEQFLPKLLTPNGTLILSDSGASRSAEAFVHLQALKPEHRYHKILDCSAENHDVSMCPSRVVILGRSGPSPSSPAGLISSSQRIVLLEKDVDDLPAAPQYRRLRDSLRLSLSSLGVTTSLRAISSCTPGSLDDAVVISLLECDEPWISTWSSDDDIRKFRDLITQSQYILWITTGGIAIDYGDQCNSLANSDGIYTDAMLEYAPTSGLLRSVRAEYPHLVLPHLDVSCRGYWSDSGTEANVAVQKVLEVLKYTSRNLPQTEPFETEFAERNGRLLIPRVVGDESMDAGIQSCLESSRSTAAKVSEQSIMNRESGEQNLGPDYVLIRLDSVAVEAIQETDSQQGVLREAIGVVQACDQGVLEHAIDSHVLCFLPADPSSGCPSRSFELSPGGTVKLHRTQVVELPAVLAEDPSAIHRLLYWLGPLAEAWNLLRRCGVVHDLRGKAPFAMSESDRVQSLLIDTANETLRDALIRLCRWLGLRKLFVVGLSGSKNCCMQGERGQPHENITYIPRLSRGAACVVLRATGGTGVDIVVTSLQNPADTMHLVPMLAPCGKLVVVDADVELQADVARYAALVGTDASVTSVRTSRIAPDALGDICRSLLLDLAPDFQMQRLTWAVPPECHHRNVAREDVHRFLGGECGELMPQRRATLGLLPPPLTSAPRPVAPEMLMRGETQPALLDADGTYVIAGGLGALGLEIAALLFEKGAGRVLLLSRSGNTSNPNSLGVLDSFIRRQWDCRVVKCDITSQSSVLGLASLCVETGSVPIRGIIQCAMVLQDSMLDNMTIEKWRGAVNPKVRAFHALTVRFPSSQRGRMEEEGDDIVHSALP